MKSEKGLMHLLIAGEVIALVAVVLFGIVKQVTEPKENKKVESSAQENQIEELPEDAKTEETEEEPMTFSEEVEAMLKEMTLEEKVAQLFLVSPEALTGTDRVTIAGEGTRSALTEYPVGGILYAKQNYLGQVQMRDLLGGAQSISNELTGRYLFTGITVEIGEKTVIACGIAGQEETMANLIAANTPSESQELEDMEHILLVQEISELPQEREAEILYCYRVTNGGPAAVEAMNQGADMLCVTDVFTNIYKAVLEAVKTEEISERTLRQAVGRILTRKQELL